MSTEHTLAENLMRLQSATEDIADAITEKGGTASYSDGLEAMGDKIRAIPNPQPVLTTKTIVQNGTYHAEDDSADGYSEVTVAVPNTYSSSDNGKVVQNGSLVSQTSRTVTSNGTYDTTTNNSTTVEVSNTYDPVYALYRYGESVQIMESEITSNGYFVLEFKVTVAAWTPASQNSYYIGFDIPQGYSSFKSTFMKSLPNNYVKLVIDKISGWLQCYSTNVTYNAGDTITCACVIVLSK